MTKHLLVNDSYCPLARPWRYDRAFWNYCGNYKKP